MKTTNGQRITQKLPMPNYLCHERFFDFKVVCLYRVTVTKKYNPIEVNIFSKQYHYFSCFESGVSKRRLLRGKLCVSYSVIFKLVEFHLLCDNQMAAMLFWLAFISLLPQGRCPGYICVYMYVYFLFSVDMPYLPLTPFYKRKTDFGDFPCFKV